MPEGAVRAGHDKDGGPLFAGRAYYENDILPAKIVPNQGTAYVSYDGQEHQITQYEVRTSQVLHPSDAGWWLP